MIRANLTMRQANRAGEILRIGRHQNEVAPLKVFEHHPA
jgi:hypothetical protein